MKFSIYILYILVFTTQIMFGQTKEYSAEVCTWKNNKPGAISISFDDGSYTQYEYAYPILEKFNFKASFSLVGVWTKDHPSFSSEPGVFEIKKWDGMKLMNYIIRDMKFALTAIDTSNTEKKLL